MKLINVEIVSPTEIRGQIVPDDCPPKPVGRFAGGWPGLIFDPNPCAIQDLDVPMREESRWIDVPAHRILEVPMTEVLSNAYQRVNTEGNPPQLGEAVYRVIRQSDGKVFKPARFLPADFLAINTYYLEDI